MKCNYTSKCPVSEMDCYLVKRYGCIFKDMFDDLERTKETELQEMLKIEPETKLQIELGGI